MAETQVNILINAVDNFSGVMRETGNSAQIMADRIEASSSLIETANERSSVSLKGLGTSMAGLMTSVTSLVFTFDRMEKAQYTLNRAQNLLEDTTRRVQKAQEAYNAAVEKYGADSPQATAAAATLKAAQDDLTLAGERLQIAQSNINQTMLSTAAMIIPAVITAITSLKGTMEGLQGAMTLLAAHPLAAALIVLLGIVALLITNFGGFRDTVIGVFSAIYSAIKPVVDTIIGLIQGLYDIIKGIVDAVAGFIAWLTGATSTAASAAVSVSGVTVPTPGTRVGGSPIRYYQFGGLVEETGLAYLHRGETVIPAGKGATYIDNSTIHIHATIANDYDVERLADKLDEIRRRKLTAYGGRMTPVG